MAASTHIVGSMSELRGTRTEQNLRDAFVAESSASRRYLFFAQQADVEGQPAAAALFRSIAEHETGHALGHYDYLAELGDPDSGAPLDSTLDSLRAAIAAERREAEERYPRFVTEARIEGFDEIADWFETVGRAEQANAERFDGALTDLER